MDDGHWQCMKFLSSSAQSWLIVLTKVLVKLAMLVYTEPTPNDFILSVQLSTALAPFAVSVQYLEFLENYYLVLEAATFWTPTNCYYNPRKTWEIELISNGKVTDCEGNYGLCTTTGTGSGGCHWQMTSSYLECFSYRDKFVQINTNEAAISSIDDCQYLPKKKPPSCRKKFQKN